MTATEKQTRLTITENHDVVLRLDKGEPDPLRTLYTMLTFTNMILHSRIAKIKVLLNLAVHCGNYHNYEVNDYFHRLHVTYLLEYLYTIYN